jgi:exodeoxyribonuclease-3
VNGLVSVWKKQKLQAAIRALTPDVLVLLETKCDARKAAALPGFSTFLAELGYHYVAWHWSTDKKGYSGVAVISKIKPLETRFGLGDAIIDSEGRVVTQQYADFTVVAAYSPCSGKDGKPAAKEKRILYEGLLKRHIEAIKGNKMLLADLNVTPSAQDAWFPLSESDRDEDFRCSASIWERKLFKGLLENTGLVDVFREQEPTLRSYTWSDHNRGAPAGAGLRLDYVLCSKAMMTSGEVFVGRVSHHQNIGGSDHIPVTCPIS